MSSIRYSASLKFPGLHVLFDGQVPCLWPRLRTIFHDVRGPYPVQTPSGCVYLLIIVDDFSRRIFGFLLKSQTEWYEVFPKFVLRIEAELGKQNCISWLLTDNGGIYCAQEKVFNTGCLHL